MAGLSLLEFGGELFGESGIFVGKIFGFAGFRGVIVKFLIPVFVSDEAMGVSADSPGSTVVGKGKAIRFGGGIFEIGK